MNEKTKTALLAAVALLAVAGAVVLGWNAMRDNSQPIEPPSYSKLTPEERERIRREGLARRNGQRNAATTSASAPH